MKLKMLDLFSGIGGFSLAGEWSGFETVGFCEIDSFCSQVLKKHWPNVKNYGSVRNFRTVEIEHVHLITGGFPCQPFSVAGKKKGASDDRYLWPEFLRIIKQIKPCWVLAENVPGIINMELDNIFDDLEREGYETRAFCIPACAVGAPHRRERLWIVANSPSERCDNCRNNREERQVSLHKKWDIETLQSEWSQFQPQSWQTFKTQDWFESFANTDSKPSEQTDQKTEPEQVERNARMGFAGQTRANGIEFLTNANSIKSNQRAENIEPCAKRQEREISTSTTRFNYSGDAWEENQPPIPGVDDGLPNIVDRNKALGNSIVPQVAFILMKLIFNIETSSVEWYGGLN